MVPNSITMHFSYKDHLHLQQSEWVQALPWEMACIKAKMRGKEPEYFIYGKNNIYVDIHKSPGTCGSIWKFTINKVRMMCNHGGFIENRYYTPEGMIHIVNLKSGTERAVASNGLIQSIGQSYKSHTTPP